MSMRRHPRLCSRLTFGQLRLLLLATAALAATSCGEAEPEGTSPNTEPALALRDTGGLGPHLVDGEGRTLYYFANDVPAAGGAGGTSNCADNLLPSGAVCDVAWPPFHTAEATLGAGLEAADLGTLQRADGAMQTTYKGWPLYAFAQDTQAGDTKGEGVGGVWYVLPAPFYTVALRNQKLDAADAAPTRFITDGRGRTLYRFANDEQGEGAQPPVSHCDENVLPSGAVCKVAWPPFTGDSVVAPSTLPASDFGTITRPDGSTQITYQGWPLYYFAQDTGPGQTTGQGVGGVWFVL